MGTTDLPATRLVRYWTLASSLDCVWSTRASHESGSFLWKLGEWRTWRVEPSSGVAELEVRPWVGERKRRASERRIESRFMVVE